MRTRNIHWMILLLATQFAGAALADPNYPLRLNASTRTLVDQSNVPFLINGDTPWSLITGISKSEADTYLSDRRDKQFNAILVNLIEHEFNGPVNQEGELPFLVDGDFSTPNEAYFAHADWVINKAAEYGIVVFVTPAYLGYGCGSQGWCQEMVDNGPTKMRDYGRWVGSRYRDFPNIVWVAGGDTDAHDTSGANAAMEAMVQGILEQDDQHVVTAHCSRFNSGVDCYNTTWLDLNNTYSDCGNTPSDSRTDYQRSSAIPFFFIEGGYEGESATPQCARAQAYWSILSGSTGHFYGNNPVWLMDPGWQNALDAPGATSLQHLAALFQSRSWAGSTPDFAHNIMKSGYDNIGSPDYAASMLNATGQSFIAYMPNSRAVTIDLTRINGSSSKAWWFNPRNGSATLAGTFADTTSQQLTPPGSGDWVLVIDDAAANLAAPGITNTPTTPKSPTNLTVE